MPTSPLTARSYWRQLLDRAGRQTAQTIVPIIAATQTSGTIQWRAATTAVIVAASLSILKGIAGITAHPDSPWPWQLLDRAAPAAAGTIIGLIPVDLADLADLDWRRILIAATCAAAIAALAYWITPPAPPTPLGRHALVRRPVVELEPPEDTPAP